MCKQQRWLDFLADFYLDVQYKPGAQNIFPDALSCLPEQPQDDSSSGSACVQLMTLEPNWLKKVYDGQLRDEKLAPYLVRATSNDSEFVMYTVHSFSLLYWWPKENVFSLVIPDRNGLRLLLLEESNCTPLAGHMGARKVIAAL